MDRMGDEEYQCQPWRNRHFPPISTSWLEGLQKIQISPLANLTPPMIDTCRPRNMYERIMKQIEKEMK